MPVSLLLHALLLAFMLVSFQRRKPQSALPLNGVSVVFEGSLPRSNAVNAAPNRHSTSQPSPSKGAPPSLSAPPAAEPEVNLGEVQPQASEIPEAAMPHFVVPPPQPHAVPRTAQHPQKQHFLVMNGMSFNGPSTPPVLNPGHRGLDLSASNSNATQRNNLVEIQGHVGSGWDGALKRWVKEHAYYPEAAVQQGQQGNVTVDVKIDRSGKVISERMVSGSESTFLNMAWFGLWRDAHVPPFPRGTKDKTVTIRYTIEYRLIP